MNATASVSDYSSVFFTTMSLSLESLSSVLTTSYVSLSLMKHCMFAPDINLMLLAKNMHGYLGADLTEISRGLRSWWFVKVLMQVSEGSEKGGWKRTLLVMIPRWGRTSRRMTLSRKSQGALAVASLLIVDSDWYQICAWWATLTLMETLLMQRILNSHRVDVIWEQVDVLQFWAMYYNEIKGIQNYASLREVVCYEWLHLLSSCLSLLQCFWYHCFHPGLMHGTLVRVLLQNVPNFCLEICWMMLTSLLTSWIS